MDGSGSAQQEMQNALNVMVLQLLNEVRCFVESNVIEKYSIGHHFLVYVQILSITLDNNGCFGSYNTHLFSCQQVRKTCFDKCFGTKFSDHLGKNEQICLAKCMDRMYEGHAIVMKASTEMAENLASSSAGSSLGGTNFGREL